MLNMVEIDPGYEVHGSDLGVVEVGPGYGVNGFGYADVQLVGGDVSGYDDVELVGALGNYADVQLVGALGLEETTKKYLTWGGIFVGGVAAGIAGMMLLRR